MNNLNKELKSDFSKIDESVFNVTSLLKLIIFENFGEKVEIIYSIVNDNDKFSKILYAFENMSIKLPSVEEFKSLVMLSIIYYYKDVMKYDWNKIQLILSKLKRKDATMTMTSFPCDRSFRNNVEKPNLKINN